MNKRRNFNQDIDKKIEDSGLANLDTEISANEEINLRQFVEECLKQTFTIDDFVKIINALNSNDRYQQHFGIIGLRKILSTGIAIINF